MNITGANKIELLKKGKKQILLIGDYHYHYKKDGCSVLSLKKTMLVPEFIENIVKTHDDKNWDFYFEQGVMTIDGNPDYDFLNKDNYFKFLNSPDTKLSTYGTFITLSKFIKRNF